MYANRLTACLGAFAVAFGVAASNPAARAQIDEREQNAWPGIVRQFDATGRETRFTAAGPFLFSKTTDEGTPLNGFRPFWIEWDNAAGRFREGYFLYPLFSYRTDDRTFQWSFFELIRHNGLRADAPADVSKFDRTRNFEVWPFWLGHDSYDPAESYHALFPVAGTIKNRLGFERASWVAFPLYTQTEKRGVVTTSVPWPIIRVTTGAAHGFGIWPLFEVRDRPGAWHQETYLWPLGYNNTIYPAPDAPPGSGVRREIGLLPLYARHSSPGYIDENFLWPFFGYTDRTQPVRYHETRYLWPFLVQGRGSDRYVNRWGPLYTHSVVKGYDKTWYAWPVVRHAEWSDRGLAISQTRVLYFLFSSEVQRSSTHPEKPAASLTHLWPLFSNWENGAGRQQFQLFSPLDVFFTGNEKVRAAWSPLFALARYEATAPGDDRTSLLWNAISWRHSATRQEREFHLGPLFSVAARATEKRVAIGNGLVSFRRDAANHWTIHWLDFPKHTATAANQPR